jgi:uncharacterized membrane protein YagU involved in acid resistance
MTRNHPAHLGTYALRGAIGAMAMTAMRVVTARLNLLPQDPPKEIFEDALPQFLELVPREYRDEAIELAHWGYGAVGGTMFVLLPAAIRRHRWSGPAYGIGAWSFFEGLLAPMLGLRKPTERPTSERAAIFADHVLYGLIVAGGSRRR